MNELVSVIMPTHNQANYLLEAVESVKAQTYHPIELIMINDGSTDNTSDVAKFLRGKYPDIVYLEKLENQGVVKTVNAGYERAQGEYVMRLDGDDRIPSDYVEKLFNCLQDARKKSQHVAYAYCDAHYFQGRTGIQAGKPYSLRALLNENYIHAAALIWRPALTEVSFLNPVMTHGFEDWDLWLSFADQGYKGVYCKKTYLEYRIRANGRNMMANNDQQAMRKQVYDNHRALYKKPSMRLSHFGWKVQRRLKKYIGLGN